MHCQCTAPEEWRAVIGYEGWYSVSSCGRVRRDRAAKGATVGRILIPRLTPDGYLEISLYDGSHRRKRRIHQLVAPSFLGPTPPGREPNHIDGDRANCHASNLEYMTHPENLEHGRMRRQRVTGLASNHTRLTVEAVRDIKHSAESARVLAQRHNISEANIYVIRSGKTWRHVD